MKIFQDEIRLKMKTSGKTKKPRVPPTDWIE